MSSDPQTPGGEDPWLAQAREKLRRPARGAGHWAALAAAAFFALCAIAFAVASVLAPPVVRDPAAKSGVR